MSGGSRTTRYWTAFYDDPEEARADATTQITEQIKGSWQERSGRRMLLEDWIDVWVSMLGEIEPTTRAKYKYFVEGHILPEFQGRQLGSLTFEEIEAWDNAIPKRISARGRPYARVGRHLGTFPADHDPRRRRARRQDRAQPRRAAQGPPRPDARERADAVPHRAGIDGERHHPIPGPLHG